LPVLAIQKAPASGFGLNSILEQRQPPNGNITPEHLSILSNGIGAVRVSPEEVAGSSAERSCPVDFIGSYGRTGLAHLLFGSVAECAVEHAQCPVLVVKLPSVSD
jgi:hypothetical protein